MKRTLRTFLCIAAGIVLTAASVRAQEVYLEEMTWTEVRDRMLSGAYVAIIPTGGTEQNGPHLVNGKHNFLVGYTSGEIARQLGNALVAPVIAYVPEGRISPPEGHMRFPGTISVMDETFAHLLEDAARSLKQHGFRLICFIGDHGGSQEVQQQVADRLNAEWRAQGARVLNVADYYKNNGQKEWAAERQLKTPNPSAHAGFMDTSEMLSLRPAGVRQDHITEYTESQFPMTGVAGDPREATEEYGRKLLSLKVGAAVGQIRNAQGR